MNNDPWGHVDLVPGDSIYIESEFYTDPLEVEAVYNDGSVTVTAGGRPLRVGHSQIKGYVPRS